MKRLKWPLPRLVERWGKVVSSRPAFTFEAVVDDKTWGRLCVTKKKKK